MDAAQFSTYKDMSNGDHPAPHTAESWLAAGLQLRARNEHLHALTCFERARALAPHAPEIAEAYAFTLARLERFHEARDAYRVAAALAPVRADLHHALGWVHEQLSEFDAAIACYRRALELDARLDGAWNNLANCLQTLGRFAEAHDAYRAALAIAPQCTLYYRNLVQSARLGEDDPYFARLAEQVEQSASRALQERAELHFAYAKALADNGRHDESFAQLLEANALHRCGAPYDEAMTLGLFEQLPQLFPAELLASRRGLGDPSTQPVFILGMPRSGSTLIEQILASHPQVYGAGERSDFSMATLALMQRSGGIHVDALEAVTREQWQRLGADYLARLSAHTGGAAHSRVTDKYPFNFINLGFIHMALPNARFIHTRRAPVETCLSIFSRIFRDVPFGYDLGELGRYYRAYDAVMAHWRRVLPPGVLLEVDYETLVEQPEAQVRRLLEHCALPWDARCLAFHETEGGVSTASAAQVRQPLYRTSLKRWRPDAALLKPLFDGLGPDLAGGA